MTSIKKITLLQFKNYNAASFEFKAPVVCITGPNGSGKTNLLDAVYYLCYTKSYFSTSQQNAVKTGTDGFRLEGVFVDTAAGNEVIGCKWKAGKKEVFIGGVAYERITDHIGKFAAVMIAPDDMELINGGSELRRKWMDGILSQTNKDYLERLFLYQKILLQRNAWLKMYAHQAANQVELDYYSAQLAAAGAFIHTARAGFIERFIPLLSRYYEILSGGREQIRISYNSDLSVKPLDHWLAEGLEHDFRLQRTLRGIHKDDLDLFVNDLPLKQFGSQGQKKSYLFAIKLAQYEFLSQELGRKPILLLDDIFEKLDQRRMEALLSVIRDPAFGQVILTDTHRDRVGEAFGAGTEIQFIQL